MAAGVVAQSHAQEQTHPPPLPPARPPTTAEAAAAEEEAEEETSGSGSGGGSGSSNGASSITTIEVLLQTARLEVGEESQRASNGKRERDAGLPFTHLTLGLPLPPPFPDNRSGGTTAPRLPRRAPPSRSGGWVIG